MKKPTSFDFNLIVIGGGAAGLVTSYIAATMKAKVALIEKDKMGGECLNTGCVPSKALIKSAKVMHLARRAHDFGIKTQSVECDFSAVMERLRSVIKTIEPHDSVERFEGVGVECIQGEARVLDPWRVEVKGKVLKTKSIVVATGSRPFIPQIPGIEKVSYLTNENLWKLTQLPKALSILGGGAIGVEMAQAFQRLGSQVTLIESGPRILSKEDPEVSTIIHETLEKEGVRILCGSETQSISEGKISLSTEIVSFDEILIATGRRGGAEGLGLREIGVSLDEKGFIKCDPHLRTNISSIYACGDANGERLFTHMASAEAEVCAMNSLLPLWRKRIERFLVPRCTYTDPEVAHVGETETSLKENNTPYDLTTFFVSELDRAITEGEREGVVRVFTKKGSDKILGVSVVSSQASTVLGEFTLTMKQGKGLDTILSTTHVYPSFGEMAREVASDRKLRSLSPFLLKGLKKYFTLRR